MNKYLFFIIILLFFVGCEKEAEIVTIINGDTGEETSETIGGEK